MKKSSHIRINYRPLDVMVFTEIDGSAATISTRQVCEGGTWTPDFTIIPLKIRPVVRVKVKDSAADSDCWNSRLANVRWTYRRGTATRELATTDTYYPFLGEGNGDATGTITVKKNTATGLPVVLTFMADLTDPRTSQVLAVSTTVQLDCSAAAPAPGVVRIDCPVTTIYDPIAPAAATTGSKGGATAPPPAQKVVNARYFRADQEVAPATAADEQGLCRFLWQYRFGESKSWLTVGDTAAAPTDFFCSASGDGDHTLTIDQTCMGEHLEMRCLGLSQVGAAPSALSPDDNTPMAYFDLRRRCSPFDFDISAARDIPATASSVGASALVRQQSRDITGHAELRVDWYAGACSPTGGKASSFSPAVVAQGYTADIPSGSSGLNVGVSGSLLECEVSDRGSFCAWADADGAIITDADGAVLLIR